MTVVVALAVGVAGGVGAVARALIQRRAPAYGTLAINVSGALLLGVLAGATVGGDAYRIAAVGGLGAFTTFSGWVHSTHRLAVAGKSGLATLDVAVPLIAGLLALWLGHALGAAL